MQPEDLHQLKLLSRVCSAVVPAEVFQGYPEQSLLIPFA